ncbi:MAG: hypothetical protein JWQ74_1292 [Marmoricola sp.]|nr:hypothetical protein [Marmoricola sp.]
MTPRFRTTRLVVGAAATVTLAFSLSSCGSGSGAAPTAAEGDVQATPRAQVTSSPAADAKVIKVTITADGVDPSGAEVALKRNQPVVLQISAAKAGELHVHSTPEQHVEFPAGESEITLSFEAPGVIAVEDHALDKLIVQLEVS